MTFTDFQTFIGGVLTQIPWWHWVITGLLALTVPLLARKKTSAYGAIALGLAVFWGLFLLDAAVVSRIGRVSIDNGVSLSAEWGRFLHETGTRWIEVVGNVAVFVPFGFFLSEFLASTKRFSAWRRIGLATLAGFGLSLCIECLQLVLRVGFFEVTDLVMNTVGVGVGGGISAWIRAMVGKTGKQARP